MFKFKKGKSAFRFLELFPLFADFLGKFKCFCAVCNLRLNSDAFLNICVKKRSIMESHINDTLLIYCAI